MDDRITHKGEVWYTHEAFPRKLIVDGRSEIDPDCLVARIDGEGPAFWIVDGGRTQNCYVTALKVRASQITEALGPTHYCGA